MLTMNVKYNLSLLGNVTIGGLMKGGDTWRFLIRDYAEEFISRKKNKVRYVPSVHKP